VLDRAEALRRAGGDEGLLGQLARLFLGEAPAWLAEARAALEAGDAARVQRAAHTIKGAVGVFGAAEAFTAAFSLESRGRAGELVDARTALTALERALERLGPALRGLAGGAASTLEVPT
jgi:HPt (histidine-containing phosphotransfer) domain-containing protein